MSSLADRDTVFISYSHKNRYWLDQFVEALEPECRKGALVWRDEQIDPGTNWEHEIRQVIERAKVALLLVSKEFLESEFITRTELPLMLAACDRGELLIRWVPLTADLPRDHPVSQRQAALAKPLEGLDGRECEEAVADVCREILTQLGQHGNIDRITRKELQDGLAARLHDKGIRIEREETCGTFSVLYHGLQHGIRPVAIKAIVASPLQSWAIESFDAYSRQLLEINGDRFITVYDTLRDREPHCIIMELVKAETLKDAIEREGNLAPRRTACILRQVARILEEVHRLGLPYEPIRKSPAWSQPGLPVATTSTST